MDTRISSELGKVKVVRKRSGTLPQLLLPVKVGCLAATSHMAIGYANDLNLTYFTKLLIS